MKTRLSILTFASLGALVLGLGLAERALGQTSEATAKPAQATIQPSAPPQANPLPGVAPAAPAPGHPAGIIHPDPNRPTGKTLAQMNLTRAGSMAKIGSPASQHKISKAAPPVNMTIAHSSITVAKSTLPANTTLVPAAMPAKLPTTSGTKTSDVGVVRGRPLATTSLGSPPSASAKTSTVAINGTRMKRRFQPN